MNKPTCNDLFNDEDTYESVYTHSDSSWRHGSYVTEVFERSADGTFWQAKYQKSGEGETHGLREGRATIDQVEPYEKTVTAYRKVAA